MTARIASLFAALAVAGLGLTAAPAAFAQQQASAPDRATWDVRRAGPYLGIRAIGSLASLDSTNTTGFTGTVLVENDSDQVAGPAIVGGWVFHNFPLRAELEVGHRVRFDYDVRDLTPAGIIDYEMNIDTTQVLVNMVLEWRNTSTLTPFIGGTVGWARNHTETQRTNLPTQAQVTPDQSQDNIAWGGILGINWRFSESWSTDLTYRYINLGPVKTGVMPVTGETIESDAYHSHDVLWSIYYHF